MLDPSWDAATHTHTNTHTHTPIHPHFTSICWPHSGEGRRNWRLFTSSWHEEWLCQRALLLLTIVAATKWLKKVFLRERRRGRASVEGGIPFSPMPMNVWNDKYIKMHHTGVSLTCCAFITGTVAFIQNIFRYEVKRVCLYRNGFLTIYIYWLREKVKIYFTVVPISTKVS